jgi:hypothetical protein
VDLCHINLSPAREFSMNLRIAGALCGAVLVLGLSHPAGAGGDKSGQGIIDKAIKALGGEEKLAKAQAYSFKTKGTASFGDNDNPFTAETTVQDLDHSRRTFQSEFGGNSFKAVTILNGAKGWRNFADNTMDLENAELANEKRNAYLSIIPITLLPLKSKNFKVEALPDSALKVVGPEGKDFTLTFDKDSGLPSKLTANVVGFGGMEFMQETSFAAYKDFDGIKRATKLEAKRDGNKFMTQEVTEFKILNKVEPKLFDRPE